MKLKLLAPYRTHLCLRTGALSHQDPEHARVWDEIAQTWEDSDDLKRWNRSPVEARFHQGVKDLSLHGIEYVDIGNESRRRSPELVCLSSVLSAADGGEATEEIWNGAWSSTREWGIRERRRQAAGPDPQEAGLESDIASLRMAVRRTDVSFRTYLFDNTVGVLTADIELDRRAETWQRDAESLLSLLRIFANAFADRLLRAFYTGYLGRFLETLASWERGFRHRHRYLRKPLPAHGPDALLTGQGALPSARPGWEDEAGARLLWTARCLDLSDLGGDPRWQRLAGIWLKDVAETPEVEDELRRMGVVPGDAESPASSVARNYSLRWLHYLHGPPLEDGRAEDGAGPPSFEEAWSIMVDAQYHYATLEVLNANLDRVISESYVEWATSRVSRLNARLDELMARTDLLIVSYRDWQKYLPRRQLQELRRIMMGWDFETIIEQSRRKTELCAGRIETLHKRSVERSAFIIDVALIVIGFLSFVSLFLQLSQYGRTLLETEGQVDMLARIFTVSTDVLLIIALALIFLLTLLYSIFRRKRLL